MGIIYDVMIRFGPLMVMEYLLIKLKLSGSTYGYQCSFENKQCHESLGEFDMAENHLHF